MTERDCRLVQEPQRDPAGGEMLLGAVVLVDRRRRAIGDLIGHAGIAEIEQLARNEPPLDPPLIEIAEPCRVMRHPDHPLRGFGDLVGAAQPLDAAEHIAGVVPGGFRDGFEQCFGVAGLVDDGGARLGDGKRDGVEMTRSAQPGVVVLGIKPHVHARLVVRGRDEPGEDFACLRFKIGAKRVAAPGIAHRRLRAGTVALRE